MSEQTPQRIAILTSGGDAPGMNAAVRAATLLLLSRGHEVVGVKLGYRGLMQGWFRPLNAADVSQIIREGGTILGSARCPEFLTVEGRNQARQQLQEAGIQGLLVIGGNGSLTGALALSNPEEAPDFTLSVIGIPASIDNDIGLTGIAIGVDTAMNTIVDACDRISDTASSHERVFVIEVMGRDCGYLAMASGISTAADSVLFREADHSEEEVVDLVARTVLKARKRTSRPRSVLVIKSEGVSISNERLKALLDERLRDTLGPDRPPVETRVTVLGHVVRGGRPSAFDRLLASRLAYVGTNALLAGHTRKMVAWLLPSDLPEAIAERSQNDPYCWLVDLEAVLHETGRLLDGSSPLTQWRIRVFDEIEELLMV